MSRGVSVIKDEVSIEGLGWWDFCLVMGRNCKICSASGVREGGFSIGKPSCGVRDGVLDGDICSGESSFGELRPDVNIVFWYSAGASSLLVTSLGARSGRELSSRSSCTDHA